MTGTYLQLRHGFIDSEKHVGLSSLAMFVYVCGLMYSSERRTDGRVPKGRHGRWAPHLVDDGHDIAALAGELVAAGVWSDEGDHWLIVNFLEHNRSREEIEQRKAKDRDRKRTEREKQRSVIPDADTDTDTGNPNPPALGLVTDSARSPNGHDWDNLTALQAARRQTTPPRPVA